MAHAPRHGLATSSKHECNALGSPVRAAARGVVDLPPFSAYERRHFNVPMCNKILNSVSSTGRGGGNHGRSNRYPLGVLNDR